MAAEKEDNEVAAAGSAAHYSKNGKHRVNNSSSMEDMDQMIRHM